MNKTLVALAIIGALVSGYSIYELVHKKSTGFTMETETAFTSFKATHNKKYASMTEESYRKGVFAENFKNIQAHNAQNLTWTQSMNHFGDLTAQEFKAQYLGYNQSVSKNIRKDKVWPKATADSVDWTTKGAVTDVKNQGQCGSCWAFSATGGLEGGYFLKTGKLTSLSEQQLVACSKTTGGNAGCKGGLPELAYDYVEKNGMETESDYPYRGMLYFSCNYKSSKTITDFKLNSYNTVPKKDSDALRDAVASQPISIGIAAQQLQFYSGGVFNKSNCGDQLDHGVLIVGYGSDNGTLYWKIKNSWGGSWGESGYFRILRATGQGEGMCGVTEDATAPLF